MFCKLLLISTSCADLLKFYAKLATCIRQPKFVTDLPGVDDLPKFFHQCNFADSLKFYTTFVLHYTLASCIFCLPFLVSSFQLINTIIVIQKMSYTCWIGTLLNKILSSLGDAFLIMMCSLHSHWWLSVWFAVVL